MRVGLYFMPNTSIFGMMSIEHVTFYAPPNTPKWTLNVKLNKFFSFHSRSLYSLCGCCCRCNTIFFSSFVCVCVCASFRVVEHFYFAISVTISTAPRHKAIQAISGIHEENTFACSWAFGVAPNKNNKKERRKKVNGKHNTYITDITFESGAYAYTQSKQNAYDFHKHNGWSHVYCVIILMSFGFFHSHVSAVCLPRFCLVVVFSSLSLCLCFSCFLT